MFNIQEASYSGGIEQCKEQEKAALSTIFWDMGSASYVSMLYKALRLKPSPFAAKAEVAGHLWVPWLMVWFGAKQRDV